MMYPPITVSCEVSPESMMHCSFAWARVIGSAMGADISL